LLFLPFSKGAAVSNTVSPSSSFWKKNQQTLAPWLFLAPGILMFVIYVLVPIVQSIWISFHDWDGLGEKVWIGLGNYVELLDDDTFYVALKNNLIWLVLYLLSIPAGPAAALFLQPTRNRHPRSKSPFFFPFLISQVVVGLVFTWVYAPRFCPFSNLMEWVTGEQIAVLADERYVTYGIIVAGLWPQTAYCMILYLTGLNTINPEQVEAARMDGAKGFRLLWNIILPQLGPATFIAMVVTVIGSLRSFDLVSVMTAGGPYGSSQVLSYFMYEQALSEYGFRMGYGAAIAVVLFLIMMVFISLFIVRMLRQERNA